MANTITVTVGRRDPAGQTVVQVSEREVRHGVLDTANTGETSIVVLNSGVWREAVLLINVSALAGTTPQLIFNVWQLDISGNRYPAPGTAPANNGFVTRTISTTTRTRDTISVPMGATIEVTFNTGTSAGAFSATFDVEVQLKSA